MDAEGLAVLGPLGVDRALDFATGLAGEVARAAAVARGGEAEGVVGTVAGEADEAGAGAEALVAGELDGPPVAAGDTTGALTAGAEPTGAAE